MPNESRVSAALDSMAVKMRRLTHDMEEVGPLMFIPLLFIGPPLFFFGRYVVLTQASAYNDAGVPASQAIGGAIASHAFAVAALTYAVVALHRHRYSTPVVPLMNAAGVALLFAVLPGVVAGQFWLTVLLTVLVTVLFDLLIGVLAAMVALRAVRPHHLAEPPMPAVTVERQVADQPTGTA